MKLILPLLLLVVICSVVVHAADKAPARTKVNNKCNSYRMCDAEADTGECKDPSGTDEIVFRSGTDSKYTFYSTPSSATDYICNIHTSNVGFTASSDQVNTATITDEAPVYLMSVLLQHLWVACNPITGGTITIDMVVCPRG